MDEINFDKYKEFWVLTSFQKVEEGPHLGAPQVRIIHHLDGGKLKSVLLTLFEEEMSVVPRPDFDDPDRLPGIKPAAFNLKSPRQYFKDARVFNLRKIEASLSVEEWRKEKWSWVAAEPLWKREFRSDQLEELIAYLIEKTSNE